MGALIDTEISVHFRLRSTLRTGQGSFTMNTTDTARKLARAILEVDADPTDVADAAMLVLLNLIHAKGGNRAEGHQGRRPDNAIRGRLDARSQIDCRTCGRALTLGARRAPPHLRQHRQHRLRP